MSREKIFLEFSSKEENLTYVQVIRCVAMIVIVTLHVTFPLIYKHNSIGYFDWWTASNIYIFGKLGSPLFTMVSGLLLLNPNKTQSIGVFFKKRFAKVLFPFLIWSIIYLLWRIHIRAEVFEWKEIIKMFVQGPVYYHLWFIQMILGLYLATPILRFYTKSANRENITYFIIVWFIGTSILPLTSRFLGITVGLEIYVTTGFVGFYVLGYYLRYIRINPKYWTLVLAIVGSSIMLTQLLTYYLTVHVNQGVFDNSFLLSESFNIVIATTGVFLFLKSIDYAQIFKTFPFIKIIVRMLSSTSLGVYFIHVLIIEELLSGRWGLRLHGEITYAWIAIPFVSIVVLYLSYLSTTILKKIPLLRHAVP